jgi:predicted transcriptional regulator of viral defense system
VFTLNALIATRGLITTEDAEAFWRTRGTYPARTRDRALAALCASGELVSVRRGLYARAGSGRMGSPDPYLWASHLAPDAVLGLRTALEVRGVVVPNTARCIYFTRLASTGRGPTWCGTMMQPISHPVALVRVKNEFVETELVDGNGCSPIRVATVERAFVDVLDRPRLTGDWPDLILLLGAIAALELDRVIQYLAYLDNATTAAKVGWFLERHQEQFGVTPDVLCRLERMRPRGPHYLSRTHRVSGRYVSRWNLVVPPTL